MTAYEGVSADHEVVLLLPEDLVELGKDLEKGTAPISFCNWARHGSRERTHLHSGIHAQSGDATQLVLGERGDELNVAFLEHLERDGDDHLACQHSLQISEDKGH